MSDQYPLKVVVIHRQLSIHRWEHKENLFKCRKGRRRVSETRRASRIDETGKSRNEREIGGKSYVSEGQLWGRELFTAHVRETGTLN